jgi:hypothetical protein
LKPLGLAAYKIKGKTSCIEKGFTKEQGQKSCCGGGGCSGAKANIYQIREATKGKGVPGASMSVQIVDFLIS